MTTTTQEELLALERRLVTGGGEAYRELLAPEAVVIVPGARLDREQCAAAIDAAPGWDAFAFDDALAVAAGDGADVITYTFRGRRGEDRYEALMTSVYATRSGARRLVLHQQTPLP